MLRCIHLDPTHVSPLADALRQSKGQSAAESDLSRSSDGNAPHYSSTRSLSCEAVIAERAMNLLREGKNLRPLRLQPVGVEVECRLRWSDKLLQGPAVG